MTPRFPRGLRDLRDREIHYHIPTQAHDDHKATASTVDILHSSFTLIPLDQKKLRRQKKKQFTSHTRK
jgi:hypothetical protein